MNIFIFLSYLLGVGFLLMCSSFFSGSETALTALTKTQIQRIREDKKKSSGAIIRFLDEPQRLFITVLFGNTLVNMAFVSITGGLVYTRIFRGGSPGLAYIVAIVMQTLLLLLFGEITPKTYAIHNSERFSRAVAKPLWFFSRLIFPIRKALRLLTDVLLPVFGVRSLHQEIPLTGEEMMAIIKSTEEKGALGEEEGEILHNIFELHDIAVKEVMIPRTQMVCVEVSKTIEEAFHQAMEAGYSRLPVFRKTIDNICGIFSVKDLPRWKGLRVKSLGDRPVEQLTIEEFLSEGEELSRLNPGNEKTLIRPPFWVYESKKIGSLLREMTREKQQMAILLDEYGGVSGLITVEDIVEEVLGEIFDEYDKVTALTITRDPHDPSSVLIPGFASLRSVNKSLNLRLDVSMADTISGYVIRLFGSIPNKGDVVTDRANGLEFEVLQMEEKRISLLKLRRKEAIKRKKQVHFHLGIAFFALLSLTMIGASPGNNTAQAEGVAVFSFGILFVLALVLLAFYEGSETAVVSASRARIEVLAQQENRRALIIKKLWQEPDKMLGILLVGTNLMSAAAGVAGLRLISYVLPGRAGFQEFVNTVVMTFLILIFCEILPKTTFRARADSLALFCAPALRVSEFFLRPIVKGVTGITNAIIRAADKEKTDEMLLWMREELKLLAKMGAKEGVLKREQLRMINSVLDLERMTLAKVMTPLVDMTALPRETSIEDYYKTVSQTGYSRIPVYESRVDNIVGLVNVLDVLCAERKAATIAPFVRKDIRYEPESRRVYSLLRELRISRSPMVFVVDEYGGVVGLVTLEDLIEEILGDIRDEKDREDRKAIHSISDRVIECDGKTEIVLINNRFGMSIPPGDYNTVGGYVFSLLERIPEEGEIIETEAFKITVLDADDRRVRRVRIQKNI